MEIRAFRGWRYRPGVGGDISPVIAPPYDVLNAQDKQALLAQSSQNIVKVDLPHVPAKEVGPEECYRQAAAVLTQWQAEGTMIREAAPALYAYEQTYTWAGKTYCRRAMLCGVRATELGQDVIPHEHTFAGPKADRLKLTQYTNTQLSPIFGFYDDPGNAATTALFAAAGKPLATGTIKGVREALYAVTDPAVIAQITALLAKTPVFIADGHHRYTTQMNLARELRQSGKIDASHEANFVMFALVAKDDPGLLILPTHRVVSGLRGDFSVDKLAANAAEFDWRRVGLVAGDFADADAMLSKFGPGAMGFVSPARDTLWVARLKDQADMAKVAPEELPVWRELDVSILHKLVLDKALTPWRTPETTIEYTPDGVKVLEALGQGAQLGACLQGTPLRSVEQIALAGASMPHKSTYFYPKLSTGIVLKPLE